MLVNIILTFSVVGGMRRFNKMLAVYSILILFGLVFSFQGSAKQYIIVDKNGSGDFASIQKAIDASRQGDIIIVKPGTYHEILNINKRVIIRGEDKSTTVISPQSSRNGFAIVVRAKGAVLENLSITNRGSGMYAQAIKIVSSNVALRNCFIYDVPVGVSVWSSNNIIKGCEFWNCKDEGIVLMGTKYTNCSNNSIIDCSFHHNCDGIELQYATNNAIENCRISNNTHNGIDAIDSHSTGNLIVNCTIANNQVHGVFLSAKNKLVNCSILKNKDGNLVMKDHLKLSLAKISTNQNKKSALRSFIERLMNKTNLRLLHRLHDLLTRYGS